jgi:hypothetical protein
MIHCTCSRHSRHTISKASERLRSLQRFIKETKRLSSSVAKKPKTWRLRLGPDTNNRMGAALCDTCLGQIVGVDPERVLAELQFLDRDARLVPVVPWQEAFVKRAELNNSAWIAWSAMGSHASQEMRQYWLLIGGMPESENRIPRPGEETVCYGDF